MTASARAPRPRVVRLLGAWAAGLVLVFGGTCGVGPTSLSLLAVSAAQTTPPDDARSQAPAPQAAEAATPDRRVVRRLRARGLGRRVARVVRSLLGARPAAVTTPRGPPPLRGPPLLLG